MAKKLFYRIGEACKQLDIQPYVLRYWETEFPVLSPRKSKAGQRVYSEEELQLIQRIKELLYEEGYTIAGAKKKLESELAAGDGEVEAEPPPAPPRKASAAAAPPPSTAPESEGSQDVDAAPMSGQAIADGAAEGGAEILDSGTAEQVETLRSGLRRALIEAREILALLAAASPQYPNRPE